MSKNISDFISKLDKLNDEKVEVFIPSRNKTVKIKPLNLKQQKDIISSTLNGIKGALDYTQALNTIILDNSGITELKIYDKIPFSINLRVEALGSQFSGDEGNINLQAVLNNITKIPFELEDKGTIEHENLKIGLEVPTLEEENELLSRCQEEINTESNKLKDNIGTLYLLEIAKYIESLQIDDDVINMSKIRISERIQLIEKLPLAVYTDISKFIQTIDNYELKILTVNNFTVPINPLFFDSLVND
tara:strand:- start:1762 stop:2502 length:741 start_codon:yes stop_codon:yes gene_type:complete